MPDVSMSPLTIVGTRIRQAREARGLSQTALAARVGVGVSRVVFWEHAPSLNLMLSKLSALSTALSCSIGYLIGEHDFLPKLEPAP